MSQKPSDKQIVSWKKKERQLKALYASLEKEIEALENKKELVAHKLWFTDQTTLIYKGVPLEDFGGHVVKVNDNWYNPNGRRVARIWENCNARGKYRVTLFTKFNNFEKNELSVWDRTLEEINQIAYEWVALGSIPEGAPMNGSII